MSVLVCGGAQLQCSFGLAPSNLNIAPKNGVMCGQPVACITDNVPMTNIAPFGMCSSMNNPAVSAATAAALGVLTPQPCTPVIASPWSKPSDNIFLGSFPAITNDSTLMCNYGGLIKLMSPGQMNVRAN